MKKISKLWIMVAALLVFGANVDAKPFKNPIEASIKKAEITKSASVSVSFKEIKTGKKSFEMNQNSPLSAASVQKIVTIIPAMNTLGESYEFKTQIYKNNNNLYIKLGADPYFTSRNLKDMLGCVAGEKINTPKAIYVDDSILDSTEWGEGWQWDNDLNPLMPKFGSYNMDRNLLTINVCPTTLGAPAEISTNVFYPTAFINNVTTGTTTNIKLERKNYISPDVINAEGTVSKDTTIEIPVNYPRRYFILRLEENLRKQKISYYGDFNRLKLPKEACLITEIKHPVSDATFDILKKSNNMVAETVFKIAGGEWAKSTGSADSAIEMFNEYYKNLGINTDNVKIVDGSGVSKNNLLTADFVTEVLLKNAQGNSTFKIKTNLAGPGEGTLENRMLYFKDNLKAKTGTLTNVSSIAGYLTAKSGKNYAFCIIINDPKSKSADKKAFEEYVLREAYEKL